jgi:hypothetical protein
VPIAAPEKKVAPPVVAAKIEPTEKIVKSVEPRKKPTPEKKVEKKVVKKFTETVPKLAKSKPIKKPETAKKVKLGILSPVKAANKLLK